MRVKLLFTWILFVYSISVLGQSSQLDYRPFAQEGKLWKTQVGGIKENVYGNRIEGDTIINDETWKKVFNYIGFPDFGSSYYAAIRDEGQKVYAIAKGSTRPRLLYDFTLKEGDIVRCGVEGTVFGCLLDSGEKPDTLLGFPFVNYLLVERIDTIDVRGMEHRRFTFIMLDAFRERMQMIDNIIWIEGVGSGAGPFSPWMPLLPRGTFFQSCEIDRTCIIGYSDFYENSVTNAISNIQSYKKIGTIYDLQGRRLMKDPEKGLYIQDGQIKMIK